MKKQIGYEQLLGHVSGKSEFIGDILKVPGELICDLWTSKTACGKIISLDLSKASLLEGIHLFTAADFEDNLWGSISADAQILADGQINYYGEPIVIVAGPSREKVEMAKSLISADIKEERPICSIEEAYKQKSFHKGTFKISRGDVRKVFKNKKINFIKGHVENLGQEHFYLETQSVLATPNEGDGLIIESSTQHTSEVQHVVAHSLGLHQHQVVSICKRLGGAFGGKESQSSPFAAMAALVAYKLKRKARLILRQEVDILITGKRHPFCSDYQVAFDDMGKIKGLMARLSADGGAYLDLSPPIMQRAIFHVDNAYFIPNISLEGKILKTNLAPNTALRGFGAPQGVSIIEKIILQMAFHLKKDTLEIQKANLYQGEKQKAPYGQLVQNNTLPKILKQLTKEADYSKRLKEIQTYNQSNKFKLRGISFMPLKFGISFTKTVLNQGNALLNLYKDGTMQVSTGACEMGQGVSLKIQETVSEFLGVDHNCVRVMPTSTEKNPNTSPTAASSGADINCQAALNAATLIKERLCKLFIKKFNIRLKKPSIIFKDNFVFYNENKKKKIAFKELVMAAYLDRVNLSAQAFHKTPNIHFDEKTGKGHPFHYYTNGGAISEVMVDRFSGEIKVLRSDILMDLGRPLNKEIDLGQVAGAFVQGLGLVTSEKLHYSEGGILLSNRASTYKIPSIGDIPRIFNIDFLKNDLNTINIKRSKAVGEPPLLLALSIWTAIMKALHNQNFNLSYYQDRIPFSYQ